MVCFTTGAHDLLHTVKFDSSRAGAGMHGEEDDDGDEDEEEEEEEEEEAEIGWSTDEEEEKAAKVAPGDDLQRATRSLEEALAEQQQEAEAQRRRCTCTGPVRACCLARGMRRTRSIVRRQRVGGDTRGGRNIPSLHMHQGC